MLRRAVLSALVVFSALTVPTGSVSAVQAASPTPTAGGWSTMGGEPCQLLAGGLELPLGLGATCTGVRPGAQVRTPIGVCTMNFMWRGSDGATYMGTAGHCVLSGTGVREAAFKGPDAPLARDGLGNPIGRFAYAAQDDQRDIALIRLDPGVEASPQVCFFGGPTSLDTGPGVPLERLRQVGQGRLFGALIPARTELAVETNPDQVLSAGLAGPGDSGAPLLGDDGRAVAIVVATGPAVVGIVGTGVVFSTRVAPQIARATEITGIRYDLVTAPRLG